MIQFMPQSRRLGALTTDMLTGFFSKFISPYALTLLLSLVCLGQADSSIPYKSQEVSEVDGIPVLIKHLPRWEQVKSQTAFATNPQQLKSAAGERAIIDLIDFSAGTEAVTAPYDSGRLVIVEFMTPQGSIDADTKITAHLYDSGDKTTIYRRIGNYNALVLDARDAAAANLLLDEVKYEKDVQWLGDNPFLISAERAFILTTSDIFLSTVFVILIGIGVAIITGVVVGYVYFQTNANRRARLTAFSDAGGMTRLNLDGFTSNVSERFLKD